MADEEGRHAEAGGVADAEVAANVAGEGHGGLRAQGAGDVLDEVVGEAADQPDEQHFRCERAAEARAGSNAFTVCDAELAVAVDGGRAHQIADRADEIEVGLAAGGEAVGDVLEQTHRFVCAAQDQIAFGEAAGFLERRVACECVRDRPRPGCRRRERKSCPRLRR